MRHIRGEIAETPGTHSRGKFEPLSPTYLAATFHDIDDNLVTAMMMRPGVRIRLESDGADPGLSSPGTGEIKCGGASAPGRSTHGHIERLSSYDRYAVRSPLQSFPHCQLITFGSQAASRRSCCRGRPARRGGRPARGYAHPSPRPRRAHRRR